MKQTTIWLLDVDDVINGHKAGWSRAPKSGYAYYKGERYRMRWEPRLIERIRQVHYSESVRVLWATSWCGYTDQLERLFGLPQFDSVYPTGMNINMKQSAALEVVESGSRLIWTDDEAVPDEGTSLYNVLTKQDQSLLIKPKTNRGLRPEHLDLIDTFVLG